MLEKNLQYLADIFKKASASIYIVGGYIRDKKLNKNPSDVDLCSSLTLEEVEKLLIGTNFKLKVKNAQFGTAEIYNSEVKFEYSVFRQDIYNKNPAKHNPTKVRFVKSLELDATRRDFTINAIYYDLCKNKLYDSLGGLSDIKNKFLRMVTPTTLQFDGERILRLARFYAELNFNIEQSTILSAKVNAKNVLSLSKPTIERFLNVIKSFSEIKKKRLKNFFEELNLPEIIELITK